MFTPKSRRKCIYWFKQWPVKIYWCLCYRTISALVCFFVCVFSVRLVSVLRGHSANDLRLRMIFYPRFYPLHLFSYLNSWERASIFPSEFWVLNKGTTGTIYFYNVFGMTRSLTGIEPGTSRTRSQHYTTKLSRRR